MKLTLAKLFVATFMLVHLGCSGSGSGAGGASPLLAQLSLTGTSMTPAFNPTTTSYSATVPYTVTSMELTAALSANSSLWKVNGATISSNSATVFLNVGENEIRVEAGDAGGALLTYTLHIVREDQTSNVNLSALAVSSSVLAPSFTPTRVGYTVNESYSTQTIRISPTAANSQAVLKIDGVTVTSGQFSNPLPLSVGTNSFDIEVTYGSDSKHYSVTVVRGAASNDAGLVDVSLSAGALSIPFDVDTLSYSASVPYLSSSITLTAISSDTNATLTLNGSAIQSTQPSGALALSVGTNTFTLVATAEDGVTQRTYTLQITRPVPSAIDELNGLTLDSGTLSPTFSANTLNYTVSVPYSTTDMQLTAEAADDGATITINGTPTPSLELSGAISLSVGANTINVVVTAENGIQTTTYAVVVTRAAASSNNQLSQLLVSPGVLSPSFSASTYSYTVLLSNLAIGMMVTPSAADANAQVQIRWNGGVTELVQPGDSSTGNSIQAGPNTVAIRVTAENGATQDYNISVIHNQCGAGYYDDGTTACLPVTVGFYSPLHDNDRYTCINKPANAHYTSPTASTSDCPWSCNDGFLTTDGLTCNPFPNATILSCNDDEVAVGLYGRSGSIIDRLGVRCATIVDGVVSSQVRNGPYYGGTGGSVFNQDCPVGTVAFEIDGDKALYSGAIRQGRIRYRCMDLDPLSLTDWSNSGAYWGSSLGLGAVNFQCGTGANPHGTMVNGLIIDNAGGAAYVGALLGITCR